MLLHSLWAITIFSISYRSRDVSSCKQCVIVYAILVGCIIVMFLSVNMYHKSVNHSGQCMLL